ncbi:MAG: GNAT family N-acetyltransferase [Proteobacteria bacterium]|nr:GNAT family N-acetyltransferase [Pseudomonadota bacterium]
MSSPDDIRALEARAFRAWPALETRSAQGWVQRFASGYTKRANSINALDPRNALTHEMKSVLEAPYRARGLPPIWRLTPLAPAGTDDRLANAGYRRIDESLVQRAILDDRFVLDPEVRIAPAPSDAWLAGFATLSPVAPAHRATMTRMLQSIEAPVGFARVEDQGEPIAFALGVVDGDHVGLFDVLVAPPARRRGLARRLTRSIGAWGREHGARFAYLQVVAANAAALPLYADLGFETVYSYAYRVP